LGSSAANSRGGPAAAVLAEAARAIAGVVSEGRSADDVLLRSGGASGAGSLRSAVWAVTLGTLRWYPRLEPLAGNLLGGRKLVPVLSSLLAASLHQLEYSRNPAGVTVSSAVEAARLLRQPRAAALMNALLRRFLRERAAQLQRVDRDPAAASAHPAWLLAALRDAWPEQWQQITAANNVQAPLTLRVDLSRSSLERYCAELLAHGMTATTLPWSPTALVLAQPVAVSDLPGFADGVVSVQDAGAQLACRLLEVQPGECVLDACAAPGGKTGALLEAAGALRLTAVDIDARRLERVAENLSRLKRTARLVVADLCEDRQWWDGVAFDRILLDVPCSALGVIRRHPDIKLLRRPEDIGALARVQRRILEHCLTLLKPGGRLLYSTCSVLPAENDHVVAAVLADMPRVRGLPSSVISSLLPPDVMPCSHGVQLLPGNAALTDGFYYACLTVT